MPKQRASLVISPLEKIGLSRLEAAGLVGVTPSAWDELVRHGDMPRARRIGAFERWDRREVESAFSNMPHVAEGPRKLSAYSDVA